MSKFTLFLLFTIFSIVFLGASNDILMSNIKTTKETIALKIEKQLYLNPPAASVEIEENLRKRTLIYDENGLLRNQVIYEEIELNDSEIETLSQTITK